MSVVRLDRANRPKAVSRSIDQFPDVLTLGDVAEILRRSPDRTRTWLRKGEIHAVRVGGQWRVAKSVLVAFLSGQVNFVSQPQQIKTATVLEPTKAVAEVHGDGAPQSRNRS